MTHPKHVARVGLVYASQDDMAARIAYRAEPCKPDEAPEDWGQYPDCYGCCFAAPQTPDLMCNWSIDLFRNVRCFDKNNRGVIWVKVDMTAPESRVDIYDGIKKWERMYD